MSEYDCFVHNSAVILGSGLYATAVAVGWVAVGWDPMAGTVLLGLLYGAMLKVYGRWEEPKP